MLYSSSCLVDTEKSRNSGKQLLVLFVLLFTVFFSYTVIAQELGSIRKGHEIMIPEKIHKLVLDPLPAGTYSVGTGGYFPTIDSAFNKLSIDGIAGEVTLELIDNLYTAPAGQYGYVLNGPIIGVGPNSRIIIKPASNHNVTIQGNNLGLLILVNTSYVTFDGVGVTGATTLTINALQNASYVYNDALDFNNNSDHNIIQNITFIVDDYLRPSAGIWFSGSAPDSNFIQYNVVKKAGIFLSITNGGNGNIIRGNQIGSETDSLVAYGIEIADCEGTLIENNIIQNMKVTLSGSNQAQIGIALDNGSNQIIRNNVIRNLRAISGYVTAGIYLGGNPGGGDHNNQAYNNMVYNIQSSSTQPNAHLAGIYLAYQSDPKVYYNSVYLSGTGAIQQGSGALYIYGDCSNVEAKNNILVNTRDESPYCASAIYDYTASNLTSDYNDLFYDDNNPNNCLVRIGSTKYNSLTDWQATGKDLNSYSEMPHFVDPYLHINPSVLTQINGGAFPITEITTDFDGDLRNDLHPDIGADEFLLLLDTLYVPSEYSAIQAAINAAVDGNLVLVDEGTYIENINFKGKAITVASHYLIDGDETHIENTIIDGSQPIDPDSASVVTFRSGEDTNSVICGFTITGGSGTNFLSDAIIKRSGGGIFVYYSNATIKNNIVELNNIQHNNDAFGGGIGAYSQNANNYIIENNIVRNNSINSPAITYYSLGGGIYTGTIGKVRIVNNKVLDNSITATEAWGGGVLPANFGGGNYLISNNIISGNHLYATTGGSGGVDVYNHSPTVRNNVITNNSAPKGGGVFIESASPIFENNTIANNTATVSGGGLEIVATVPVIVNCILWGNSAPTGLQINGTADVSYSDVEGGITGTGNINQNPEFITGSELYLLAGTSPCIDAGNPDQSYNDPEDPNNLGYALYPAMGTVRNDMGAYGGPNTINWIVTSVENDGKENSQIPNEFELSQNYPNPFNPSTTFRYSIPTQSKVVIKVYDILGSEIVTLMDEEKSVGTYELTWNAASLPSGVYFYQLRAVDPSTSSGQGFISTKKMLMLK